MMNKVYNYCQTGLRVLFIALIFVPVLISCKKQAKPRLVPEPEPDTIPIVVPPAPNPTYHILVLGNSITYSPANPSIGWYGNWGMAASVADSDYVHLLTARFQSANKSNTLVAKNIAEFEAGFDTYNFDKNLQSYRDAKPDMIILRIAENVTRKADSVLFEKKYVELLTYLKTGNAQVKILAVGSVWPELDMPNKVLSKYSEYISLDAMQPDLSNYAFGLYPNIGIQAHPSNKGMKAISDRIWVAAQKMLY